MKRLIGHIAITITSVLAIASASAQDASSIASYTARVSVVVSSSDDMKSRVKSFLTRELRELPGVVVTDSEPNWLLSVIAMEIKNQAGTPRGYAISYTLRQPFDATILKTWSESPQVKIADGWLSILEAMTTNLSYYMDHQLMVGPLDALKQTCEGIVADLDANHLEPERQMRQSFLDAAKKQNQ